MVRLDVVTSEAVGAGAVTRLLVAVEKAEAPQRPNDWLPPQAKRQDANDTALRPSPRKGAKSARRTRCRSYYNAITYHSSLSYLVTQRKTNSSSRKLYMQAVSVKVTYKCLCSVCSRPYV